MEKSTKIVIDASVIIKWFIEEHDSEIANQVKEDYQKQIIDLSTPDLLSYEVLNVLRFKPSMGENDLCKVAKDLEDFQLEKFTFEGDTAKKTVKLSLKYGITVYDAAYVSLAAFHKSCFLTADEKLTTKLQKQEKVLLLKTYPKFREKLLKEHDEIKNTSIPNNNSLV